MNLRGIFAIAGGLFFTYAGVLHFTDTSWFEPIVPPILGSATFWVLVSGVVEIAVGLSLIMPKTRKLGGYSSAALLVALYPANLYMWVYDVELGDGASLSPTGHVVRLFAQIAGIMISLWIAEWKPGVRPNINDLLISRES
ncbi:MAG: hypothetical protein CMA93_04400 [Euryarchaeota archaeon]|nr:hypothetical protein [Euryarchaeota archaeon]|tara:strand:- start:1141 stop:1563 length:423 start_codon:yes stop_codon:yes gene_type:complete